MTKEQLRKQYKQNPGAFIEAYQFELDKEKRKIMWQVILGK